jgi:hypothetical protein
MGGIIDTLVRRKPGIGDSIGGACADTRCYDGKENAIRSVKKSLHMQIRDFGTYDDVIVGGRRGLP